VSTSESSAFAEDKEIAALAINKEESRSVNFTQNLMLHDGHGHSGSQETEVISKEEASVFLF